MQPALFHKAKDRLSAVKAAGLYSPCVDDVYALLDLYKKYKHGKLLDFLNHVNKLITTRTLALHRDCRDVETGFDIAHVLYPTYGKLKLYRSATAIDEYSYDNAIVTRVGRADFRIPIMRNENTRPTIVLKRYHFKGQRATTVSKYMSYTFIKTGELGYPVSIVVDGIEFTRPVLIESI